MSLEFLNNYLTIIIFLAIAIILSLGFLILNFAFSPKNPDPEKLSAYECGFEPFNDSRMEFDIRFYLVAILFIIEYLQEFFRFFYCQIYYQLQPIRLILDLLLRLFLKLHQQSQPW